jgi:hypothetical protein
LEHSFRASLPPHTRRATESKLKIQFRPRYRNPAAKPRFNLLRPFPNVPKFLTKRPENQVNCSLPAADRAKEVKVTAEFWNLTWQSLRPGLNALLWLVAISPLLIWGSVVLYQHRYRGDVAPPQQEKILRPPGYSLHVKLDDLLDSILQTLAKASLMFLIATMAGWSGVIFARAYMRGTAEALNYGIFFTALFTVSIIPGLALMRTAILKMTEARNTRLGLRGEQAVAEALYELGDAGYRTFHDLQPDGTWNIDHVIVGTRGVFVIETKARCRRPPKRDQPKQSLFMMVAHLCFRAAPIPQRSNRSSVTRIEWPIFSPRKLVRS